MMNILERTTTEEYDEDGRLTSRTTVEKYDTLLRELTALDAIREATDNAQYAAKQSMREKGLKCMEEHLKNGGYY